MWFHNVVTEEFSIGVNVFWKHLDEQLYEKKDVYGKIGRASCRERVLRLV